MVPIKKSSFTPLEKVTDFNRRSSLKADGGLKSPSAVRKPLSSLTGFTLVEIAVSMALAGILALAISSQFLAMARFKTVIENKAEPSREAFIVLDHMTRVLRFAKATGTISFVSDASTDRLTTDIESGHIALIPATIPVTIPPSTTACYYQRYRTTSLKDFLYFQIGSGGTPQLLSKYVTYFDASITGNEITLKLIFSKGGTVTPVQTKIRMLVQ